MPPRLFFYLLGAGALGFVVYLLATRFPGALETESDVAHLVRAVMVLGLVSVGVLFIPRRKWKGAAGALVAWLFIGAMILGGYVVKDDLGDFGRRVFGALVPSIPVVQDGGEVTLRRDNDGHFRVQAEVNGTLVRFLIDTGATVVALSHHDAVKVGIEVVDLAYTQRVRTANGEAWTAPVRIGEIKLGPIVVNDVRGSVADRGAQLGSLLGMSFLERLKSFEVRGDTLILRP